MVNVCVIPARSGSKRIKNKNIKEFCGEPIYRYALKNAIKAMSIDDIVIYTNDEQILKQEPEFCSIKRKQKNAGDKSTLTDTLLEFISNYKGKIDNICLLLPTAVFATDKDIDAAFNKLKGYDAVTTFSIYPHPIERAFSLNSNVAMIYPAAQFVRTQDFIPKYHDAGQFYWINVDSFLKQKKIYMKKLNYYILDAVDIDNEKDWDKAEALFEYGNRNR